MLTSGLVLAHVREAGKSGLFTAARRSRGDPKSAGAGCSPGRVAARRAEAREWVEAATFQSSATPERRFHAPNTLDGHPRALTAR